MTEILPRVSQVYGEIMRACVDNRAMAGSCMWMTAAPSYADYDGTTVYLQRSPSSDDAEVAGIIRKHAAALKSLSPQPQCVNPDLNQASGRGRIHELVHRLSHRSK